LIVAPLKVFLTAGAATVAGTNVEVGCAAASVEAAPMTVTVGEPPAAGETAALAGVAPVEAPVAFAAGVFVAVLPPHAWSTAAAAAVPAAATVARTKERRVMRTPTLRSTDLLLMLDRPNR